MNDMIDLRNAKDLNSLTMKQSAGVTVYQLLLCGFIAVSVINSSVVSIGPVMTGYSYLTIASNAVLIICRKRYRRTAYVWIMLALFLFCLSAYKTGNISLLTVLFFVLAYEGDMRSIVKTVLIPEAIGVAVIAFLAYLRVLPDYTYYHGDVLAHSFGFYYYSTVPTYFFFCSIMYIYLRNRNLRLFEAAILLIMHYVVYRVFTVRATFYLGIASVFFFLFANNKSFAIDNRWFQALGCALFPIAAFSSVIVCKYLYSDFSPFWRSANLFSSNRIAQSHYALSNYPVTLFGQRIEMRGSATLALGASAESYFYIDSGFVFSVLVYGVAVTAIVLYAYAVFIGAICRENEVLLLFWMISICVFSLINNALMSIVYCPILLGVGQLLVSEERLPI